jgi:hypothetical protein
MEGVSVNVDNATPVMIDLALGADASWRTGKSGRVYLDARFNLGLTNPFRDGKPGDINFVNPDTGKALKLRNVSLDISLGFSITDLISKRS